MTFSNSEHTVKRFDVEIQQLVNLVLDMGREVEQQVTRAVTVFREGDAETAQAVIAGDAAVNRWDMEIDRSCVRLLSRRQPMSTDLRLVSQEDFGPSYALTLRHWRERFMAKLHPDAELAPRDIVARGVFAEIVAIDAQNKVVVFDKAGALGKLEGFASLHGPAFYGLPRNQGTITLRRESWTPPDHFAFGEAELKPLRAGEALPWRLVA